MVGVGDLDGAGVKLAHHVPGSHPGALAMGAYAGISSGAEIVAPKAEEPTKRDAIFLVNKELEERHALLSGEAVELAFFVIGLARDIAGDKGIVNGISDRAALREY